MLPITRKSWPGATRKAKVSGSSRCSYSHLLETALFCLVAIVGYSSAACGSPDPSPQPCIEAKLDTGERPHPGNFDYASCNSEYCHADWVGGWVYNNPQAEAVVQGATVTVQNSDGTVLGAVTRSDGFFVLLSDPALGGYILPPFTPCVSRCPSTVCADNPHTNLDCQSSGCHGRADSHLYVPQPDSADDLPCENLPWGGPRVHDAFTWDTLSCQICHDSSYFGGFVYDGLTSNTAVARATVSLFPMNGSPIYAVTGPGGMFQFENGIIAPYTACVGKCDFFVCSRPDTHPTIDDCRVCHDESNRIHVP